MMELSSDAKRSCPRGHWRPGEDEKLRRLVERFGPQNWNSIADKLQGRSGDEYIAEFVIILSIEMIISLMFSG